MRFPRSSGILLHPTSLPGRFGIGDLGIGAYRFADFLKESHQRLWQVLPLGPTGYGDSPYQCFSAFAGNPLLIDLEKLVEEGYLSPDDLEAAPKFSDHETDYGAVIEFKFPLLRKSFFNFQTRSSLPDREAFENFCQHNADWLDDYALFMAVKEAHGGVMWTEWEPDIAARRPESMARWSAQLAEEIQARKFWEFEFFRQWTALKDYCHRLEIRIMGDIPIYVAHDSADVWTHRELFYLDESGNPTLVAGVPPDYFSATGQLWGNPIYRWEVMAQNGFAWWIQRFRSILSLVDIARLDHFRGFEGYWEIAATEKTAVNGRWVKGPGAVFFDAVQTALGELPIVAENLGLITPEVVALKDRYNFPGMAVLQFAFGADPQSSTFRPPTFVPNLVIYTGTHDNDTTIGWWTSAGQGETTRTSEEIRQEREFALQYLGGDGREMNWTFIQAVLASVADTAIIPLQDMLGLGSEARMNLPGRPNGNWRWRFTQEMLTSAIRDRLKELTVMYGRESGER